MTKNLLTSALFAGVAAGLVAAALQFGFVIPALLEGELYESGQRVHFAADGAPQGERGGPGLGTDYARHAMTAGFNLVAYTGFGLILVALMALADRRGIAVSPRAGLVWGLAGFVAVQLAPAFGLPPELPGTPAADLGARQAWWLGTAAASAAGLGLIAFARGLLPVAGVLLLALPHRIGAPPPDRYSGVAPLDLDTIVDAAAALLALLRAWFWTRGRDA